MTDLELDLIYWLSVLGVVLGGSILLYYAVRAVRLWREKRRQAKALRVKIDAWALRQMALEQLAREDRYLPDNSFTDGALFSGRERSCGAGAGGVQRAG